MFGNSLRHMISCICGRHVWIYGVRPVFKDGYPHPDGLQEAYRRCLWCSKFIREKRREAKDGPLPKP